MSTAIARKAHGRWIGRQKMWRDVAAEPEYWPTLIGEAVTGVQTIYDAYEDIGRHRQDRFLLRVPTGRLDPHTVDYKICEITLEGRPAPEWGCYLRLGSLVEVTLGS
jgi:hypothetical protein